MTNSISEIENNDLLFVIGSNTTETHPIIGLKMKKAIVKGTKLIVADRWRIDLVRFSHLWLQQKPGTDVALLNSVMHVILNDGLEDGAFIDARTEGFEEFKASLSDFTPEAGERITGVPKDKIIEAARLYGRSDRPGIYYTMGITQVMTVTPEYEDCRRIAEEKQVPLKQVMDEAKAVFISTKSSKH